MNSESQPAVVPLAQPGEASRLVTHEGITYDVPTESHWPEFVVSCVLYDIGIISQEGQEDI